MGESTRGAMPSEKLLAEMGSFNEELVKAGMMPQACGWPMLNMIKLDVSQLQQPYKS